jgi:predicted enzyme related to lactoylglutathione lyase
MGLDLVPQEIPEAKGGKNRAHLDVEVTDLDASLERVVAIGGSLVECIKSTNGEPLLVCADPDATSSITRLPDEGDGPKRG